MFENLLRKEVNYVPPYVPGKTIEEVKREYGLKEVIKLASNENPYGPSPKVLEAIKEKVNEVNRYPPVEIPELKTKVADYVGVKPERIVFGTGVDGVLETIFKLFCERGTEVIIPIPTFPYYEILTRIYGGKPVFIERNEGYDITPDLILNHVSKDTGLIILCSPNNPTGDSVTNDTLSEILESVKAVVIVDEAYAEFSDWNALSLVEEFENIIITRTFSKAFGLAGLRIGYGILPRWLVPHYMKINPPFSLGTLSIIAAVTALEDVSYMKWVVEEIRKEREWLSENIPMRTFRSQANFLMVDTKPFKAREIVERLLKKGIIVRDLSGFRGSDGYKIRITVGKEEENRELVEALGEITSP